MLINGWTLQAYKLSDTRAPRIFRVKATLSDDYFGHHKTQVKGSPELAFRLSDGKTSLYGYTRLDREKLLKLFSDGEEHDIVVLIHYTSQGSAPKHSTEFNEATANGNCVDIGKVFDSPILPKEFQELVGPPPSNQIAESDAFEDVFETAGTDEPGSDAKETQSILDLDSASQKELEQELVRILPDFSEEERQGALRVAAAEFSFSSRSAEDLRKTIANSIRGLREVERLHKELGRSLSEQEVKDAVYPLITTDQAALGEFRIEQQRKAERGGKDLGKFSDAGL